ncbi:hypothetical protein FRC11_014302 [Ceratobasidium sp. 423]|nr:hypothetical protein FRC11_014302 [Ceratobasidium sp. 423]
MPPFELSPGVLVALQSMRKALCMEVRARRMYIPLWNVCGEPCEHQTCKECSDNTPDSVVDLLRQIHLRDLGDDDTLDSITITLPCRHVFTVETLDSITHIHDFYQQDTRGEWVKAIMPDASYVCDRPVCPHCGGGIDSLRYGRILKHSNHSILQHNIACRLSGQLSRAEALLSNARYRLEREVSEVIHSLGAANIPVLSETARRDMLEKIDTALAANEDFPTNLDIFQNLSKLHGLPPKHAKAWRKAVDKIMESYEIAYGVACELDPSIQQYESSLERLYMEELDRSGGSPVLTIDSAQQRLQQLAGKIAHTRIGHPRPRASDRFTIEALWVTIEIFMLIGLATSRACEEIWQQNVPGANLVHWDSIAEFLLLRASKDAETAYRLADESKSWNKAILCRLLILQTKYEHASHRCRVAIRNGSLSNRETRDEYLNMCTRNIEQIQGLQASIPRDYQVGVERDSVLGATEVKEEWVEVHFTYPSDMILDAWADLALAIQAEMPEECQHQVDNEQLIIWSPIIQETATSNRECKSLELPI